MPVPMMVVLALLVTSGAQAQTPAATVDPGTLGPQVGAVLPAFALSDQHDRPQTLESVMGPNGAMVVFFRSASW